MGTYHRGLTEFQGYPLAASTSPDSFGHAGAARNSDRHRTRSQPRPWDQPAGETSENDTNEPTVDEFDGGAIVIQNDEPVRVAANSSVDRGLDKRSCNACPLLSDPVYLRAAHDAFPVAAGLPALHAGAKYTSGHALEKPRGCPV